MTDDIVKRLRRTALFRDEMLEDGSETSVRMYPDMKDEPGVYSMAVNPDGKEAADEIERLRADLAAEREARDRFIRHSEAMATKWKMSEARVAKLRAALTIFSATTTAFKSRWEGMT